jgi:hypothetical protein
MGQLVRHHARRIATTLLVSVLATTTSQALPAHGLTTHDTACEPHLTLPHDEGEHRIAAQLADEASHPNHCLVCHLARAFRPSPQIDRQYASDQASRDIVHVATVAAPRAVDATPISLRAPPASIAL